MTTSVARMRVVINGLNPLVKTSIVEFRNEEEIEAELIYERLKRHCKVCLRLDHEDKDCPSRRARRASPLPPPPPPRDRNVRPHRSTSSYSHATRRDEPPSRAVSGSHTSRRSHPLDSQGRHASSRRRSEERRYGSSHLADEQRSRYYSSSSRVKARSKEYSLRESSSIHLRDVSRPRDAHSREEEAESGYCSRNASRHLSPGLRDSSRARACGHFSSKERNKRGDPSPAVPQEALAAAVEEVRDVMIQYTNCVDPTESAARKERLRQAEIQGQVEETAEQVVRANLSLSSTGLVSPGTVVSEERVPISQRLGPTNVLIPPPKPRKRALAKRKSGRPLGRPPGRPAKKSQGKKKQQHQSPLLLAGGKSKKRKLLQAQTYHFQPAPRRRLNMDSMLNQEVPRRGASASPNPQSQRVADLGGQEETGQGSRQAASATMDFRNPSNLVP